MISQRFTFTKRQRNYAMKLVIDLLITDWFHSLFSDHFVFRGVCSEDIGLQGRCLCWRKKKLLADRSIIGRAVKRELAMRELYPQTFPQAEPTYILLGQIKIFVGYYIHNTFPFTTSEQASTLVATKNYHFPQGNNHAFVLRVKIWYPEAFIILTPQTIKQFAKQGLISQSWGLEIAMRECIERSIGVFCHPVLASKRFCKRDK